MPSKRTSAAHNAAVVASRAGCVAYRRAQSMGTYVGLYHADEAGIESDPEGKWATVCEEHHTLVTHRTRVIAASHLSHPEEWCEDCQAIAIEKGRIP